MKGFPVENATLPDTMPEVARMMNDEIRLIVFCMGVTCSGKTTFIDFCTEEEEKIGAIKVGEEMRLRHPTEYFDGLAAMDSTEDEAWEIFNEQLADNVRRGKSIILVDGQPRLPSQVDHCLGIVESQGFICKFLWFHVDNEELDKRMNGRFEGQIGALNLAKLRMINDKVQLYDVIQTLFSSELFDSAYHLPEPVRPHECKKWLKKFQDYDL